MEITISLMWDQMLKRYRDFSGETSRYFCTNRVTDGCNLHPTEVTMLMSLIRLGRIKWKHGFECSPESLMFRSFTNIFARNKIVIFAVKKLSLV